MASGAARETPFQLAARLAIRTCGRARAARDLELRVEGRDHLPEAGPALLASRHYHHLYDACALLTAIDRPLSFFVALDWVRGGAGRRLMEWACRTARWPVVLRAERVPSPPAAATVQTAPTASTSAFGSTEPRRYLRGGMVSAVNLLREGRLLVVFPEAYPNVDPDFTPKVGDEFLPFRAGFARLVERAASAGCRVPTIPTGLHYRRTDRWQVALRFGPPLWRDEWPTRAGFVAAVEAQCRQLSTTPDGSIPPTKPTSAE